MRREPTIFQILATVFTLFAVGAVVSISTLFYIASMS